MTTGYLLINIPRATRSQLLPYSVAFTAIVLTFLLTWLLQPLLIPNIFALFYPAVMACSLYGGLGPGLFAVGLTALAASYFLLPITHSLSLDNSNGVFQLLLLVGVALMLCGLSNRYRRAKERVEAVVARLRESEELFYNFMNHSPLTAFIKDEIGRYRYVSPVVERLFDRKLADWVGKTDFELFSPDIAQTLHDNDQVVLTSGQAIEIEESSPYGADTRHYLSIKFPLQDRAGNRMVAGMSLDITEWKHTQASLRESEARFNCLVQTDLIGFLAWDLDGTITDANDAFLQMIGYTPDDLQAGRIRWSDMVVSEYQNQDAQAIAELKQHRTCTPYEKEFLRKDGSRVPVLVGSTLLEGSHDRAVSFVLNQTERKRVQDALQESEERYRLLAEALPQFVWTTDAMGRVEYCNPRWYCYTGLTPEQTLGTEWIVAVHPDDLAGMWDRWQQARQTGESYEMECRVRAADGHYRWFLAAIGPARDSTGRILRWVGTSIEIEAIKRAQAERAQLLAREQAARMEAENERSRLREFFLKAPAMLAFVRGPNYIYEFANSTYLQAVGRQEPELIGKPLRDAFPEIEGQGFFEIFNQVYHTGNAYSGIETPVWYDCNNDGTLQEAYFNFVYQPLNDATGQVEGILMHAVDVTDQVRAKQRTVELIQQLEAERSLLEAVLQQLPEGVIIAEAPSGKLILGNQQVEQIWRRRFYPSTEIADYAEYPGFHPNGQLYTPDEWPLARSLTTGEVVSREEIQLLRGDGTRGVVEVSSTPVYNRQGQIMAGVVTFQDISNRKRIDQEREHLLAREQAARAEAESANRIKDEFLAVLSHELRSPLNPILGWTKLLQTRKFDEKATKRALETIERNAKLQTQLIEDLLDVSRILRGKMVLNVAPVDLSAVINSALETVQLAADAKQIQLHKQLFMGNEVVQGDANRLQQIVWNLLSNAIKFTPAEGQVEIRLEQVERYAQIQVIDTGKGIKPEFITHVFDYFRQEDGSTTRRFGGLGLGLAIVRHLTELHGGIVQVTSAGEGKGATFTVKLPLMEMDERSNCEDVIPLEHIELSSIRILVVDDEADVGELTRTILEGYGATVRVVTSAKAALTAMGEFCPDLLISDIGMPEMDGYMLIQQIRTMAPEQGGRIPAIALTGYAREGDAVAAVGAGYERHIAKPIEPNELVRIVASLIATS